MNEQHLPATPDGSPVPGPTARTADAPVGFPARGARPFPDTHPAGSAVSAPVAPPVPGGLEDWEQGTLMATLGMEVLERSADRTVVTMPVEGARQVIGILHGGASAALIETAGSVAARQAAPEGTVAVGAELQVSHLRPATAERVTAVATPVHRGRRTAVYEVSVVDEDGRQVARGTLRSLFTDRG